MSVESKKREFSQIIQILDSLMQTFTSVSPLIKVKHSSKQVLDVHYMISQKKRATCNR